jgi:dihydropteroate synthase
MNPLSCYGAVGVASQRRCLVMGVLNVTPDSFSDAGRWSDGEAAVRHGLDLLERGADIIDVGGESTRPGARRPTLEEESRRVLPVVSGLVGAGAFVSVDTMRAAVAAAAVERGTSIINDVSGGLADPDMLSVIANAKIPYVLTHWRAHADVMGAFSSYHDVVSDVVEELARRCGVAIQTGVPPETIIVDPGLGFAKEIEHNWRLLAHLARIRDLGFPVLIGASRKRFLGEVLSSPAANRQNHPATRDEATAAVSALAAAGGAWCVRVHEPRASADAVRVVARLNVARAIP